MKQQYKYISHHITQQAAKSMANHMRSAKAMEMVSSWIRLRLLLVLLILILFGNSGVLGGKNARIHIPDELDDVVDDEEDEAWKEWGQKKKLTEEKFDPPPVDDLSEMDIAQMQEEMMKRQQGPSFGFVKLRLGVRRTTDMITDIAMKWSKIARTGAIEVKFMGVDVSTIMFTMEKGQDTLELKDFILSQPEAYELKIGDRLFRRPGDPPFDDVFAELHANDHEKDEL